jgi:molecular chaperone DnaK
MKDLGEKVSAEDRALVESGTAELTEALKGSDVDLIRSRMESLIEVLQRVTTAAYQAAASEGGDEGPTEGFQRPETPDGEPTPGARSGAGSTEETVEGEFKEV